MVDRPGMTPERFVEYIQNCFNESLHADMVASIKRYLDDASPLYIAALANVCMKRHPRQYRTAPGIAEFEKFKPEAYELYQSALQNLDRKALPERTDLTDDEREQVAEAIEKFNAMGFGIGGE